MALMFEPFGSLFDFDRLLAPAGAVRPFVPAADVVVTDEDVTVVMDVPGLKADELEVELVDDVLSVRGERRLPYAGEGDGQSRAWQRLERAFGRFERRLQVPKGLDPDKIEASLGDGVLTLRIPQPEARRPRRIQITSGGGQPVIEGKETVGQAA
jgi:HSP20 family protein